LAEEIATDVTLGLFATEPADVARRQDKLATYWLAFVWHASITL
jgi:hypothetical protein